MVLPVFPFEIASVEVTPISVGARVRSRLTGASQAINLGGAWWEMQITLTHNTQRAYDEATAYLLRLGGVSGTMLLRLPFYRGPYGALTTNPTLTADHAARALSITVQHGTGQGFVAGDHISVANHLQVILEAPVPDGSDVQTVSIWPGLRKAALSGATVEALSPVGTWAMASSAAGYGVSQGHIRSRALSLVEAGF